MIFTCFLSIGIALLPMIFSMSDDIKRDLNAIQESVRDKRQRSKVIGPLSKNIQFYSDTKQFSINGFLLRI